MEDHTTQSPSACNLLTNYLSVVLTALSPETTFIFELFVKVL